MSHLRSRDFVPVHTACTVLFQCREVSLVSSRKGEIPAIVLGYFLVVTERSESEKARFIANYHFDFDLHHILMISPKLIHNLMS
jgi:hypothetical protein